MVTVCNNDYVCAVFCIIHISVPIISEF